MVCSWKKLLSFKRLTKKYLSILLIMLMIFSSLPIEYQAFGQSIETVSQEYVDVGDNYILTVANDGTVKAWGLNTSYELGLGTNSNMLVPTTISGLTGVGQLSAGNNHSFALLADGTVKAWGQNSYYQLGLGDTTQRTTPQTVSSLSNVKQIVAGYMFSLALLQDGTVKAWGLNNYGQLGLGDTSTRTTPTTVTNLTNVKQIVAGYDFAYALMIDGTVKVWGNNANYQLGLGDTTVRNTPTVNSNLIGVKQLVAGYNFGLALFENTSVKAWGTNNYGQLGLGNTNAAPTPTLVTTLIGVRRLTAGYYHTLAILDDGSVKAWGYNAYGQVGDGTTTNKTSPTLISTLTDIQGIYAGQNHTIAFSEEKLVYSWGYNNNGQLGQGDTTQRNTPTLVANLKIAKKEPYLSVVAPLSNSTLSDADKAFIPKIAVRDAEGDSLVCSMYIDTETVQRDTKVATVVPSSGIDVEVDFNPVNMSTLSDGQHAMKFVVSNGIASSQATVNFIIDKTNSLGGIKIAPSSTSFTVTGTTTDSFPGLASKPYRVTISKNGNTIENSNWFSESSNPVSANSNVVSSPYSTGGNGGRKLVKLSNGWLVAGVINGTANIQFYVSKDNGNTWSSLAYRTTGTATNGLAIANYGNTVHYLTTTGTNVIYGKIDALTATGQNITSTGTTLDTQAYIGACSLDISADGHLHAVWSAQSSSINLYAYNFRYSDSSDNGLSWNTIWLTNYSGYILGLSQPCIVIKQDNYPVIFGQLCAGTEYRIICLVKDGTTWGEPNIVYNSSYGQSNPCAVVDNSGKMHVVWEGYDSTYPSAANIRYRNSTDGKSWTNSVTKITTGNSYSQTGASITVDNNNNLFVFWQGIDSSLNTTYTQIRKKEYSGVPATWGPITNLTTNTSGNASGPSLSMNAGFSSPLYFYSDAPTSAVKYSGSVNTGVSYTSCALLAPNILYTVKFETKTLSGNIQSFTEDVCTLADVPVIQCIWSQPDAVAITISDNNPSDTDYQVMAGNNYLDETGKLTPVETWTKLPTKSITVTGLHDRSEMIVKVKARNKDNFETVLVTSDIGIAKSNDYVKIACGSSHTIALKNDGTVWAWGSNSLGQLGDGTTVFKDIPIQVTGLNGVTAIEAGGDYTLVLKNDGTVWTWGYNFSGQLGDGTTINRNIPVQVKGLYGITAIEGGGNYSIALKNDGTVWTWGSNGSGQLGDGTTINRTTPVQVTGLNGITAIAGGGNHTIALKNDGTVWTWGDNSSGQLGDGTTTNRNIPVQVIGLNGIIAIAGGGSHTIALKNDSTVWTWGDNSSGQLGDGTTINKKIPVQVSGLNGVTAITGGVYHSIALKNDGTVWTWGSNSSGQLGDGTNTNRTIPVQVAGLNGITAIAGSFIHTVALKNDGTVCAWGLNTSGQLGNGTTINWMTPVQITGTNGITEIESGNSHTVALKNDGTVWTWGANFNGQLGDGTTTSRTRPVQVTGLNGITAIACGGDHTIALKNDGTVWTWGGNSFGQLGDGTTTNKKIPVQVSELSGITAIAGGAFHNIAIKNDGTAWTWGFNAAGQLGNGTNTNSNIPVQVTGLNEIIAVSGSDYFSAALKDDGTVWSWGTNSYGQLGDGTTIGRYVPVQVTGLNGITAIAGGVNHSIALKSDGTVWTWGYNSNGQLGDGSYTNKNIPVQVTGLNGIISIAGGSNHTIALMNNGTPWTWGYNASGQLGDGTKTNRLTPAPINGLNKIIDIAGGSGFTTALSNNGSIFAWGNNNYGQLGDGSTTSTTTPLGIYGSISEVSVTDIKSQNVSLSWLPIAGSIYYDIEQNGRVIWNKDFTTLTGTKLRPNAQYSYRVRSVTATGNGEWSDPVYIYTLANIPVKKSFTIANNGIKATWSSNNNPIGTQYCLAAFDSAGSIVKQNSWTTNLSDTLTELNPSIIYTLKVKAKNGDGAETDWCELGTAMPTPKAPIVSNLPSHGTFTEISWSAVPGAVWYDIEVDGTVKEKASVTKDISNNYSYKHSGLKPLTQHSYRVRARNISGTSEWSDLLVVSTSSGIPTIAPALAMEQQHATNTTITLNWTEVIDAESYDVVEVVNGVETQILDNGRSTTCEKRGLAPNSSHTYKVRGRNSMAEGPWSDPITISTNLLDTPSNISYTESDTSIIFTWSPIAGATSYSVTINNGTPITGIVNTSYTLSELTENTKVTYSIKAVNVSGESAWSLEAPAYTLPVKPSTPANVNATVTDNNITISWDPVFNSDGNELTDPEGYDVELNGVILENDCSTIYIHNDLEPYTLHTYRVRARNVSVEGDWSPLQNIRTLPGKPKVPKGITIKSTQTGATISWLPEAGATGYDIQIFDGTTTITEYNIQKTSFTHHRASSGKEYSYMIRTNNCEGTSSWSGIIINNAIKATCKKKENVDLGLTAIDITDFSPYTMVVTYNPGVIDVMDLCTQTGNLETKAGKVEGTGIEIVEFTPGRIVFKVDMVIKPGEAWTGVINSIKFKARETGGTTITYTVFCEPETK